MVGVNIKENGTNVTLMNLANTVVVYLKMYNNKWSSRAGSL